MPDPISLRRKQDPKLAAALEAMSPEDRTRFETIKVAADKTREIAHGMLDTQLDRILPELLTHIDAGGSFAVFVVDPTQLPIMPSTTTLLGSNGKPL